jgi:carboxymethylenebutenolidase
MAEMVEFASNGSTAAGYLAPAASGRGPGVIVLQEWWGLVPQIKRMCDRLAADGFTALAPDLYHGDIAQHDEMDKAGHLMTTMPADRAARDMAGALDYLLAHPATNGAAVGVIGFCMGGMLTLLLAAREGERVGAAVPFYGAPLGEMEPDWSTLAAPVRGHFAGSDDFFPPAAINDLGERLRAQGKDVTFIVHDANGHAFANEENALGTYDKAEAESALTDAFTFLHTHLG